MGDRATVIALPVWGVLGSQVRGERGRITRDSSQTRDLAPRHGSLGQEKVRDIKRKLVESSPLKPQ